MTTALDMAASDITHSLKSGYAFAALLTTLSIPHICSSLENENNRSTGVDYKRWYRQYVEHRLSGTLSADACYSLRCGVSHQGQVSVPGHPQVDRVIFRLESGGSLIHENIVNKTVQYEMVLFCRAFLDALDEWWKLKQSDAVVQKNLPNLLRFHKEAKFMGVQLGPTIA